MSRKRWALLACLIVTGTLAQDPPPQQPDADGRQSATKMDMTPEQRQQKMMQTVGGMLEKTTALPGVLYLNLQKRVDADYIASTAKTIANSSRFKHTTETREGNGRLEILKALAKTNDVAIVIALVDDPGQSSLLMALDQGWVQVNVAALVTDEPNMEKLKARLTKQLWRATGLVFGSGFSQQFPASVMQPVRNLAALDAIPG